MPSAVFTDLSAFGEAAAVADCAASFVLDCSAAFRTGADEDVIACVLAAVAVAFFPFLRVLLKGLCYGVRAGGDLSAVCPGLVVAGDALELLDDHVRLYVGTERKTYEPADRLCLA